MQRGFSQFSGKYALFRIVSKNEQAVCQWAINWAEKHSFSYIQDKTGNVLVNVPGKNGSEKKPVVVIQGHLDMVCEKTPESLHDFSKDALSLIETEDGWLKANGTSLGADNGIAIAYAMAIAEDKSLIHPPLELFFTVDEETGLTGAMGMEDGFLEGRILLNIDSEEEGSFTIGCAGGRDCNIDLVVQSSEIPVNHISCMVSVDGLLGGHSGINIIDQRANAIVLLARILLHMDSGVMLSDFNGGTAHNAIPRNSKAIISIPSESYESVEKAIKNLEEAFRSEYAKSDPGIRLSIEKLTDWTGSFVSGFDSKKVIELILALPHGVFRMSENLEGVVETSNNIANVRFDKNVLSILTSQRSSNPTVLDFITSKIVAVSNLQEQQFVLVRAILRGNRILTLLF